MIACADCGKPPGHGITMIVLRSPHGPWQLCSPCFRVSLAHAKEEREKNTATKKTKTKTESSTGSLL
jgi:hypothetical protein